MLNRKLFMVVALLSFLVDGLTPEISSQLMFPSGTFPYAHVCSLVQLKNGDILGSFHAGSGEGNDDVKVYTVRKPNATALFTPPAVAVGRHGICVGNPNMYLNSNDTLFIMFHSGGDPIIDPNRCSTHWWSGFIQHSTDGGNTWSDLRAQPKNILGSIKNNCILMTNGEVLCPSSTESVLEHIVGIWEAHMETADDETMSNWKKRENIQFYFSEETKKICQGIIQPTLFEVESGKILALMRSGCGVLAQAISYDYGHTWPKIAESTAFPNPNAGVDGTNFLPDQPDIGLVLLYNNNTKHRTPLSLAQSEDKGIEWNHVIDLETDPAGSFAYPYIIRDRFNPRVGHACYTFQDYSSKSIKYARIEWP